MEITGVPLHSWQTHSSPECLIFYCGSYCAALSYAFSKWRWFNRWIKESTSSFYNNGSEIYVYDIEFKTMVNSKWAKQKNAQESKTKIKVMLIVSCLLQRNCAPWICFWCSWRSNSDWTNLGKRSSVWQRFYTDSIYKTSIWRWLSFQIQVCDWFIPFKYDRDSIENDLKNDYSKTSITDNSTENMSYVG